MKPLSKKQQILLDQIRHTGEHGSHVAIGRYKTSWKTLKSLVDRGLVRTDKHMGFGGNFFICWAI